MDQRGIRRFQGPPGQSRERRVMKEEPDLDEEEEPEDWEDQDEGPLL
jgi:hypothetical protein